MITAEQVKDLQPGDVVEMFRNGWPDGTLVRGALYEAGGWLYVAEEAVRREDGRSALAPSCTLTVVSRAPRPLYVNHDRTEPVPGDVVRDADSDSSTRVWMYDSYLGGLPDGEPWSEATSETTCSRQDLPARLRLLVDGETGQVVP